MENCGVVSFNLLAICILATSFLSTATNEDRKVHIVYMGSLPKGEYSPISHHLYLLQSVVGNSVASNSLILSYKRSFNGFAANLTHQESHKLASLEGVVSVFLSVTYHTQTTRSWDFMGLLEASSRNRVSKVTSSSASSTPEFGPSPRASLPKASVHHPRNGRETAWAELTSNATTRSSEPGFMDRGEFPRQETPSGTGPTQPRSRPGTRLRERVSSE